MTLIQELFIYGKGRAVVFVTSYLITSLFVDFVGVKYYLFALFWLPISFLISFFVAKKTVNNGGE